MDETFSGESPEMVRSILHQVSLSVVEPDLELMEAKIG